MSCETRSGCIVPDCGAQERRRQTLVVVLLVESWKGLLLFPPPLQRRLEDDRDGHAGELHDAVCDSNRLAGMSAVLSKRCALQLLSARTPELHAEPSAERYVLRCTKAR